MSQGRSTYGTKKSKDPHPGDFRSWESPQPLPALFIGLFEHVKLFRNLKFVVKRITNIQSTVLSSSEGTAAIHLAFTTDVRQPWTNYVNNGNKHLIVGADVRSEYSNIRYLHLIISKAQKFVSGDKYNF